MDIFDNDNFLLALLFEDESTLESRQGEGEQRRTPHEEVGPPHIRRARQMDLNYRQEEARAQARDRAVDKALLNEV